MTPTTADSAIAIGQQVEAGIDPVVREKLSNARVLIAGLGNIGSFLALLLAPLVGQMRIVDRGRVQRHNAENQLYGLSSTGRFKVDAMRMHLLKLKSSVKIERRPCDLEDLSWGDYLDTDICFGALDSLRARQLLGEKTFPLGIPYIDGAVGYPLLGRIQVLLSGSACLQCSWGRGQYQQLAAETPCVPGAGHPRRTLAPACAGATVAGMMAGQAVQILGEMQHKHSYEITGDILAGRFVKATRKHATRCRFAHATKLALHPLSVAFKDARVRDILAAAEIHCTTDNPVFEFRRGILPIGMFDSNRYATPQSLQAMADMQLGRIGLTARDHIIARDSDSDTSVHLCLDGVPDNRDMAGA